MKNLIRKIFLTSILLPSMISIPAIVQAYQETISVYGEYFVEPYENQNTARNWALNDAIRLANLQAGVHVKNISRSSDQIITDDIIEMVASNELKIQGQPRYEVITDCSQKIVRCYITALVDDGNVIAAFNRDQKSNLDAVRRNQEYLENNNRIHEKNIDLKTRYKNAKTDSERQQLLVQMEENDRAFLANEYLLAGNKFAYEEKYTEAVTEYSKAIELAPDHAETYSNRGYAYRNLKKYDDAIRDFNKAIQLDPNYALAYNNRGVVYELQGIYSGNYDAAFRDYTKAIQLDKNYADAYFNRGLLYYSIGKYTESIQDFNKNIELDPEDFSAQYFRGFAYYYSGNYSAAIRDYTKLIGLFPDSDSEYIARGDAYYALKQYDSAIFDYNKSIELNPKEVKAYNKRGSAYYMLGKYNLALADFQKVLELDPNHGNAKKAVEILREQIQQ